jgi:hypothetical protein
MEKIKNILNQVQLITHKNSEILEATGGRFNMFKICGVNHYENTHSSIIAEFLNPNGSHGLSDKFLESFLETLGDNFNIQHFNFEKARVITELATEEGRIDLFIEDDANKAIIIENKLYAVDQPDQLKRYNNYAKVHKNDYQIIYLTLYGNDASQQSGDGVNYITISYKEEIINWLEKCVSIASRFPIVRETIIQYINHLKQLTNQDMDSKNKMEITEVLSKIENLRAAKVIYQNYSATFNHIVEKHFNPKMNEFAKSKGLEYHFEKSDEFYVRFHLTNSNWQGKFWIGFTFEGNRYHYGICNNPATYRISDDNRKILHEKLNNNGIITRKESNWWPFYAFIPNLTLESWETEIIESEFFINDCKEKIEKILASIEGVNF